MINKIIDGISESLFAEFGEDYTIYTESVEQGLEEPCFFITSLNPMITRLLGNRYYRTNHFMIQYFPSSNEKRSECNQVLERLFDCLELITVENDLTRGVELNGEIVGGILNFQVSFNFYVYKVEDLEPMEEYLVDTSAREDGVNGN